MSWTTRVVHEDTEKVVPRDAIVLDLSRFTEDWLGTSVLTRLRNLAETGNTDNASITREIIASIADQIEAQTKPARIPEPGPWGVVSTQTDADLTDYWTSGPGGWFNERGEVSEWHDLRNPVLIREGIE